MVKLRSLFRVLPFETLVDRTKTGDLCYVTERLPYGKQEI